MEFSEHRRPFGYVWIEHIRDGKVIDRRKGPNVVVNSGSAFIVDCWQGLETITDMKYIGSGTGTTAAHVNDGLLETEVESRVNGVVTEYAFDTVQIQGTISYTGAHAITEAGLFDVITTDVETMFSRQVFSAINVSNGDGIQLTWRIQF